MELGLLSPPCSSSGCVSSLLLLWLRLLLLGHEETQPEEETQKGSEREAQLQARRSRSTITHEGTFMLEPGPAAIMRLRANCDKKTFAASVALLTSPPNMAAHSD
ncbi:unnamed protein product [Pleuronectes platessa]|uniref:Secreted protein n=1 Tax=Pleuronectes platessa TaxID=8262 RepID=A0A9N7UCC3_PLEPL|nr:unnamed protein product [Pleuronectes platessa]